MRESDLFEPLRVWLQGQGYHVSAEVHYCDVVATRPGDEHPVILELKTRLSLDLILQGSERQELSPSVYLVVPLNGSRARIRNRARILRLLGRLELGLIAVRFLRYGSRVEVLRHPVPVGSRQRHRRRAAIIREVDGRYAELNRAGQTSRQHQFSAYRQRAIVVAGLLETCGPEGSSPAELRALGAPEDVQRVLSANHYGWFDRIARGRYVLASAGRAALEGYGELGEQVMEGWRATRVGSDGAGGPSDGA